MSESDRAQLGLVSRPEKGTRGYARYCDFSEGDFTATVAIFDKLGPDKQVDGARNRRPVPMVGRHQAEQWIHAAGSCVVSITVSQSSTIETLATDIDGNDQRSCEIAMKLAQLVEPKLP